MSEDIDYAAVINCLEEHWDDFVEWCCAEWIAENSIKGLKDKAGIV